MRILGFYHVLLINHYLEIVAEQLNLLLTSGLYEAADKIYVGCLGEENELQKLIPLFRKHSKIEIAYHSINILEYEFPTLKILKEKADSEEPFYGVYFHVKSVTWPKQKRLSAYLGGTYWRQHMNYWNISRWKDCVQKLDEGHDTCGVKLLQPKESPAHKLHYSGNFFWIKSEYAKTLCQVKSLNQEDRMQAEFWQCSGNPKAATLNQQFIDYTARGRFRPPGAPPLKINQRYR